MEIFIFTSPSLSVGRGDLERDLGPEKKSLRFSHYIYHKLLELKKKKTRFLDDYSVIAIKCNCPSITFDREDFSQDLIRR
jgi:hypothetical protein